MFRFKILKFFSKIAKSDKWNNTPIITSTTIYICTDLTSWRAYEKTETK